MRTWVRQEHNGFSRQNSWFIGTVLNLKPTVAHVYLPPAAKTLHLILHHCLMSINYVNLIVDPKHLTSMYIAPEEAENHCRVGASVWRFCSTENGLDQDVVLASVGVQMMLEGCLRSSHSSQALSKPSCAGYQCDRSDDIQERLWLVARLIYRYRVLDSLFTFDRPIYFNCHGYPIELQGLLIGRPRLERITTAGYMEERTTTTPFDMMLLNQTLRSHIAQIALQEAAWQIKQAQFRQQELCAGLNLDMSETHKLFSFWL